VALILQPILKYAFRKYKNKLMNTAYWQLLKCHISISITGLTVLNNKLYCKNSDESQVNSKKDLLYGKHGNNGRETSIMRTPILCILFQFTLLKTLCAK
jgi:tRNA(His) 5'-end guanylyltransferase